MVRLLCSRKYTLIIFNIVFNTTYNLFFIYCLSFYATIKLITKFLKVDVKSLRLPLIRYLFITPSMYR